MLNENVTFLGQEGLGEGGGGPWIKTRLCVDKVVYFFISCSVGRMLLLLLCCDALESVNVKRKLVDGG